jgi:hypothetical protein
MGATAAVTHFKMSRLEARPEFGSGCMSDMFSLKPAKF